MEIILSNSAVKPRRLYSEEERFNLMSDSGGYSTRIPNLGYPYKKEHIICTK